MKRITFAARLKAAIKASGKSVAEVAAAAKLSRETIYQLLRGKADDPRFVSTVIPLADALGVKVEQLRP